MDALLLRKDREAQANCRLQLRSDRGSASGETSPRCPWKARRKGEGSVGLLRPDWPHGYQAQHTTVHRAGNALLGVHQMDSVGCGAHRALGPSEGSEVQRQAWAAALTATVPTGPREVLGQAVRVAPGQVLSLTPSASPVTSVALQLADFGDRGASESPAGGPCRARGSRPQETGPDTCGERTVGPRPPCLPALPPWPGPGGRSPAFSSQDSADKEDAMAEARTEAERRFLPAGPGSLQP